MNIANQVEKENKNVNIAKIANDNDWPGLDILSKNSFVIKNKKPKAKLDIDNITKEIKTTTTKEDKRIISQNQKDEQIFNSVENIEEIKNKENSIDKLIEHISESIVVEDEAYFMKQPNSNLAKHVIKGLTHLFLTKATKLLNPINFLIQNFKQFLIAFIHIGLPLVMTLWVTHKVDFVVADLSKETPIMYAVYFVIFYIASSFLSIFVQVLVSGIYSMIKKSMRDVAQIGQNKVDY